MSTIYLAGGCFWGMERLFRSLPGVTDVTTGYANGDSPEHANYHDVCTGTTGFRETVRVEYDPERIPLPHLLLTFFAVIDPQAKNRQGPDVGSQYQTGIYWSDPETEKTVERICAVESSGVAQFAVERGPLVSFYPAEEYHQRYLEKHPGGYCHVSPWRMAALTRFPFGKIPYTGPASELLEDFLAREKGH